MLRILTMLVILSLGACSLGFTSEKLNVDATVADAPLNSKRSDVVSVRSDPHFVPRLYV